MKPSLQKLMNGQRSKDCHFCSQICMSQGSRRIRVEGMSVEIGALTLMQSENVVQSLYFNGDKFSLLIYTLEWTLRECFYPIVSFPS
mmetsp:Transcript_10700/g.22978  ORF Transcript_10700/g.22978 Transcript_10700/m.22978 type:complete len:87 (-) Transcript_10700:951-1211(-)